MSDMAEIYEDYALRAYDDQFELQSFINENAEKELWFNGSNIYVEIRTIDQRYAENIIYWCEARDIVAPQEIKERASLAQIEGEK